MDIRTAVLSLFAAALLVPAAARADHPESRYDDDQRSEWREHRHDASCRHGDVPAGTPIRRGPGRYELRTISVWVDGFSNRVWVPESCHVVKRHPRKPWKDKTVCEPAHYESRWVPGHYENRTEWVWVPSHRYRS